MLWGCAQDVVCVISRVLHIPERVIRGRQVQTSGVRLSSFAVGALHLSCPRRGNEESLCPISGVLNGVSRRRGDAGQCRPHGAGKHLSRLTLRPLEQVQGGLVSVLLQRLSSLGEVEVRALRWACAAGTSSAHPRPPSSELGLLGTDGIMALEGWTLDQTSRRTSSEYPSSCWLCARSSRALSTGRSRCSHLASP